MSDEKHTVDLLYSAGLWQDAAGYWWLDTEQGGEPDAVRIGTTEEALRWLDRREDSPAAQETDQPEETER